MIAGGSFPSWERNLGTGDDPARSTRMMPSRRTIDPGVARVLLCAPDRGQVDCLGIGHPTGAFVDCLNGSEQA